MSTAKRLEATIAERPVTEVGLSLTAAVATLGSLYVAAHEIVYAGPTVSLLEGASIVGALGLTAAFAALAVYFATLADARERHGRAEE